MDFVLTTFATDEDVQILHDGILQNCVGKKAHT